MPPAAASARGGAQQFQFLVQTARPGFWTTSIWFYFLPIGGRWVFDRWTFWLGLIYVTFPLGLFIYGWNDLADAETDRINPRKGTFLFGARGDPAQLAALPWSMAAVQAIFVALFAAAFGTLPALGWFMALLVATAMYNWPPPGLKGRPPLDLLNQVGYLLVFVLSSWLNDVPQLPWPTFVFGALFAMHSHLFGQIMDIVPDRLAGRRTTVALLGLVPAKGLAATLIAGEGFLAWHYFHDAIAAGALALGALAFVADALILWRDRLYGPVEMRCFFLGWNAVAVLTLPWVWRTAAFVQPH